jgi:aldehyde:ferredoxin oxidoreductase
MTDSKNPVGKGRAVWWHENYKMAMDSLGLCFIPVAGTTMYGDPMILFEEMGEIYQAVTGMDPGKLFESAERAYQLERCYNTLLGISRKDDRRKGSTRGEADPIDHPGMLDEYYFYRGCSQEGRPTRSRLRELGLDDVIADLEKRGVLEELDAPAITELVAPGGAG